jgi:hypothetical protein
LPIRDYKSEMKDKFLFWSFREGCSASKRRKGCEQVLAALLLIMSISHNAMLCDVNYFDVLEELQKIKDLISRVIFF